MSYFGVNIKKIRVAKKLSQSDFANLFDLTRSAVGAYEEGRAEAKIDKIIEIADYFGISLTAFLTKKLTLNEILKYDIKKVTDVWNTSFVAIPYIEYSKIKQYISNQNSLEYVNRLPKISLPNVNEKYRAFEFVNPQHFLNGDILICTLFNNKHKPEDLYLLVSEDEIEINEKISLKRKFIEIWKIEFVISRSMHKVITNMAISDLRKEILSFKK